MIDDQMIEARKQQLIADLEALDRGPAYDRDGEYDHVEADELLLRFIDDERVTEAFNAIDKWYA